MPRTNSGFKFCTSPEISQGLKFAGIDVVTLSNNHTNNYGEEGFEETKKYLDELNIKSVEYDNLEIIEKNGTKYGFLGFDYTISKNNLTHDLDQIAGCHPVADVCIVGGTLGGGIQGSRK